MEAEITDTIFERISLEIVNRIEILATYSESPDGISRILFSPSMDLAAQRIESWMKEAGLATFQDVMGNLNGRWTGWQKASTIHIGSHYDTVCNAGKYDGNLGVLIAIALADVLRAIDYKPKHNFSAIAFCDEEGVRFQSTLLGSSSLSGQLTHKETLLRDANGRTLEEWITLRGGSIDQLLKTPPIILREDYFLETHIEQGPVLENFDLPVGVFTSIAAQMRISVQITGKAGHAGTTPPRMRRDALTASAEMICLIESLFIADNCIRATVGQISVSPNVSNVIPENVQFSIDLRTTRLSELRSLWSDLRDKLQAIAQRRNVHFNADLLQETADAQCDLRIRQILVDACLKVTGCAPEIISGAGHDAMKISKVCPVGMLAVRCKDGLSHHPDEYTSLEDIQDALKCLVNAYIVIDNTLP